MRAKTILTGVILFYLSAAVALAAPEASMPDEDASTIGRTPPRLSYLEGQVSFWRPGAEDWVQAQINTALAPGDQLYIKGAGGLELQVGAQAYVRGGDNAQIGLESQEPDFLRFKVAGGRASLDLRTIAPGRTVEVDTPHAAFIIEHEGYYRLDVEEDQTMFSTRRTGRATVVAEGGEGVPIQSGETVVIQGPGGLNIAYQSSPGMDRWDTWNYNRTDELLTASSLRYVPSDVYGAGDLDRYGSWRTLPEYGPVWVPGGVAPGWAPYTTGSWMYDPYYGWTWVDTAPWGWAPYHYGRWVYVNSYWCWAPGPIVARSVYAPALVAFYGGPGFSIGISVGGPAVGWVALGWGEPLIPWWGRPGFIHRPWWGGWGGPRCINNRVIHHRRKVRVHDIHFYNHARRHHGLVVVRKDHFGHGRVGPHAFHKVHADRLRPLHRAPDIRPTADSYAPSTHAGRRPPDRNLRRSMVTVDPRHRASAVSRRSHQPADRAAHGDQRALRKGISGPRQAPKSHRQHSVQPIPPERRHRTSTMVKPPQQARDRNNQHSFGVPAINRPTAKPGKRPVRKKPPAPPAGLRQKIYTGRGNRTAKGISSKTTGAQSHSRFQRPQRQQRHAVSRPGVTAPVPERTTGARRFQRNPAAVPPAHRVEQGRPFRPDTGSRARAAQSPRSAGRNGHLRQGGSLGRGDTRRGAAGRGNSSSMWGRSGGSSRHGMSRGSGGRSHGGFRRGFRK